MTEIKIYKHTRKDGTETYQMALPALKLARLSGMSYGDAKSKMKLIASMDREGFVGRFHAKFNGEFVNVIVASTDIQIS